jgi:excisionase family DNA binding protein
VSKRIEGREVLNEKLMTISELAQFLDIPDATLYQWRYRGEGPPGLKLGRHVRYRPASVKKWLSDLEATVK